MKIRENNASYNENYKILKGECEMLKLFTKKDKRTNLEREIDSVIDVMSSIKPDPTKDNRTNLEKEIDSVLKAMSKEEPDSEKYELLVDRLDVLSKARSNEKSQLEQYSEMVENLERLQKTKATEKSWKVSPDILVTGGFIMLEIAAILWHEKANVITSKAFSRITKWRL